MIFTLKDAAKYFRQTKVSKAYLDFVAQVRRVFSFQEERANRLKRYEQIVADYQDGMPVKDIVEKYKTTQSTVLRYARLNGEPIRPRGDADRKAKIIELYKKGLSIKDIADRLHISQALVSKTATEAGINRYGKRK